MRILFLVPYPYDKAPSQRFRFEQYLDALRKDGWEYRISSFLDDEAWSVLYRKGHLLSKITGLLRGYLRRISDLLRLFKYDVVFIHREASPFGLPWIEWLVTRFFGKYTVFDFDDAIWIPNASESNDWLTRSLKFFGNTGKICKWSTVVSAGNKFLGEYAARYNKRVVINPTTIDTNEHHNTTTDHSNHKFIIGWTGSHSTVGFLDELVPVFEYLEQKYDFELHVICDVPPRFNLKCLKFITWSKQAEIDDLLNFNVGIMPLPDNIWSKGKCGFKALQYMALGIPAVVSSVGVNTEIVEHEVNGCICKTMDDWKYYLERLLSDPEYLRNLSHQTRQKVLEKYSVEANRQNFLSLFKAAEQR